MVQEGYRKGTGRVQEGYRKGTGGVQEGYRGGAGGGGGRGVFTVVLCNHTSIDTYKRSAPLLAF